MKRWAASIAAVGWVGVTYWAQIHPQARVVIDGLTIPNLHPQMAIVPLVAAAVVAGAASVIGGIFNWLSHKKDADATKAYNNLVAQLHNEWLKTRSAETKDLLDKLQAAGNDIYGPSVQRSESHATTTENSLESPEVTADYQPMAAMERSIIEKRLASPTGLPPGYVEQGIQAINAGSQAGKVAEDNIARQRGISPDVMAVGSPTNQARLQQINALRVQAPLKSRELQNQDLGLANDVMTAFGRATRKTGTSRTDQYGTVTGPPDYSALANLLLTPGPQAAQMT